MAKIIHNVEPTCYNKAIGNVKWEHAMHEEMDALDANETWDLVPLPCKWVYKMKITPNDGKPKYKARLVAKEFKQQQGVDFDEILFITSCEIDYPLMCTCIGCHGGHGDCPK